VNTLKKTKTQQVSREHEEHSLDKRAWYWETRRQEQRSTWPTQTETEPYV